MTTNSRPRLAVLIDAENASAAKADLVMEIAAGFGRLTVRRAYGNWTTSQLTPWKRVIARLGIQPLQQFRYVKGKNTTDFALVMDAMELLHEGGLDGMCLVSSDSDYISLVARIRQRGLMVYGFGGRQTVGDFVAA